MSALGATVDYPVHAVAEYEPWTNANGVNFTDWKASYGATGTHPRPVETERIDADS